VIVIIGFMGAGKTTVGRMLADRLGLAFVDSDLVIEDRAGKPIREIFADAGEPTFRLLEHEVIADLLGGPDAVLALGGGAVSHPGTRSLLAAVPVVYLRVSYAEAVNRVGGDTGRPMLARPDVSAIYAERQAIYESAATIVIDTDARSPDDIALDILSRYPHRGGAPFAPR
jgi:shikimate kinase